MPDASPAKWYLAHTTWFFEHTVLEPNPLSPVYLAAAEAAFSDLVERHGWRARRVSTDPERLFAVCGLTTE